MAGGTHPAHDPPLGGSRERETMSILPLAKCGPGREAACHGRQAAPRVRGSKGHRCPECPAGAASCEEGRNPRETRAGPGGARTTALQGASLPAIPGCAFR